jgi:hypothetical protein
MNMKNLTAAALVAAGAIAAPAMAQSIATVTTTTAYVGGEVRTVTTGSPGLMITQGVPGQMPTTVVVPHARSVVWGPAQVSMNGDTVTTVQQIYVDMPANVVAENTRRYLR